MNFKLKQPLKPVTFCSLFCFSNKIQKNCLSHCSMLGSCIVSILRAWVGTVGNTELT